MAGEEISNVNSLLKPRGVYVEALLWRDSTVLIYVYRLSIEQANQMDTVPVMDTNGKKVVPAAHEELASREGVYQDFVNARMDAENWEIKELH